VGQRMVGCGSPWLGVYWGSLWGRDISVESMVLTLGWGGSVCVGLVFLTSRSSSGLCFQITE